MALYHTDSTATADTCDYKIVDGKLTWASPDIYLEGSGTQYIDTGVTADNDTYECKFSDFVAVNRTAVFGSLGSWMYGFEYNSQLIYTLSDKMYGATETYDQEGEKLSDTVICNNNGVTGTNYTYTLQADSNSGSGNMGLFAGVEYHVHIAEAKIHYFKWTKSGSLFRHFVPVPAGLKIGSYTVPSNGMFDIVNQQFYANAGTGTFTIGGFIGTTPAVYDITEVQHHQIMGAVGYTVVGTPTITDGVIQSGSNTDYVDIQRYDLFSANSFEYVVKFKAGNQTEETGSWRYITMPMQCKATHSDTDWYGVYAYGANNTLYVFAGFKSDNSMAQFYLNTVSGTTYWLRWKKENGVLSASYSTDGEHYTEGANDGGANNTEIPTNTMYTYRLGYAKWSGAELDLNHTYIKVNDTLWFYQPQPTKYIVRENPTTHEQYLVWSDPLIWVNVNNTTTYSNTNMACVPSGLNLNLISMVGYSVAGTPTITNGVISNFSGDNYAYTGSTFNPSTHKWTLRTKVKTSTGSSSGTEYIFGSNNTSGRCMLIGYQNGVFKVYLSSDGANWDIASKKGTYSFTPETDYYLELSFDGSKYDFNVSTDKETWTSCYSVASSTPLYGSVLYIGAAWDAATRCMGAGGNIDLNETYIMIDDKLWFAPTKTIPSVGFVDLPTQVFTTAGSGAIIGYGDAPEPTEEGGIDAYTMACWHFDNSITDASLYASTGSYTGSGDGDFNNNGKFSQCLMSWGGGYGQPKGYYSNSSFSGTINKFTVDYWVSRIDSGRASVRVFTDYTNNKYFDISVSKYSNSVTLLVYSEDLGDFPVYDQPLSNFVPQTSATFVWNHVALEFDSTNKTIKWYCNGHLEGSVNVPLMSFSTVEKVGLYSQYNADAASCYDELRLSKVLRYNGQDYEVPTQPYSEGSSPTPGGGGINENTLAMLHFDGDASDSSLYASTASYNTTPSMTFVAGKWNKQAAASSSNNWSIGNSTAWTSVSSVTVDYQIYLDPTNNVAICPKIKPYNNSYFFTVYIFGYRGSVACFLSTPNNQYIDLSSYMSSAVLDSWNHFAYGYDAENNQVFVYLNGTKVYEQSYTFNDFLVQNLAFESFSSTAKDRIQELRMSKGRIYTTDFTPPTQPYSEE